ncbi:hypothetical protein G3I66_22505 [Streptomyces rubrogriseus]|uniref:Uncharacterized protein n=1 Tax=Streptomyces rubrogriseus TaxID=194673 RepID=A0A6G3TGP4_9ACTN|nr:hypothetical protein [Streptomyces rubrogriseus]
MILYGVEGRRGKDAGGRVEGVGRFTYQSDAGERSGRDRGVGRVNSGTGVDVSEATGGDSKGDTRTYPESSSAGPPSAPAVSPTTKAADSCASTSP